MTRAIARAFWVLAAMVFAVLCVPQVAHAQDADGGDDDTYNGTAINIPTSEAIDYGGPFSATGDGDATEVLGTTASNDATFTDDPGGRGSSFALPDVQPGAGGTGGGDASEGLAHTGSDVEPIVAISVGLLAVGGSALVSSRRRLGLFSGS